MQHDDYIQYAHPLRCHRPRTHLSFLAMDWLPFLETLNAANGFVGRYA